MKVTALVPIKKESTRLLNKNFLDFNGRPMYRVILETLEQVDYIDEIIVNTDSELVMEDCKGLFKKVRIIERPDSIRGNTVTANTLIDHDLQNSESEHFFQTHVTNPLLTVKTINEAIETYFNSLDKYDSLHSVEKVQKRAYNVDGSEINHDNQKLLQTQDLPPVGIENSNLFIFSKTSFYGNGKSRVGKKPQLYFMHYIEGSDVDYEVDFLLARLIDANREQFGLY